MDLSAASILLALQRLSYDKRRHSAQQPDVPSPIIKTEQTSASQGAFHDGVPTMSDSTLNDVSCECEPAQMTRGTAT
jgi:hypothetical protein